MRHFVIDQLSREERENIHGYLKRTLQAGAIEGMYWLSVPDDLLGSAQRGHAPCGPFYFAVEVEEQRVVFELLVRSKSNLHCSCISYADRPQREFLLNYIDRLVEEERITA